MRFQLVEYGWSKVLDEALRVKKIHNRLRIICPFIKQRAIRRFVEHAPYKQIQIITRFDLEGFREGVSDTLALRHLLGVGAQIRGIRNLHAKVYLIEGCAIVTSANLTEQALNRNHEFGFCTDARDVFTACNRYFDSLWNRAGDDLEASRIDTWDALVYQSLSRTDGIKAPKCLGDEGVEVGFSPESSTEPKQINSSEQGFVKFFGRGSDRADSSTTVLDEVNGSTSHWALSYPGNKAPRSVRDGALMFMSRLSKPNDILIYGRGIAKAYRPGVDDATLGDIAKRSWKKHWSRYIRLRRDNAEFVNATLNDCVSLNELMGELRHLSFATTKARFLRGERNINPRSAYARQAQVELTPEAIVWLNDRLDRCFERYGKISRDALDDLIQPEP